jgi:amidase
VIEKALFDLAAQGAVLFDAELCGGQRDSAAAIEELLRTQRFGALVGASGGGLPCSAQHPHVTVPAGYVQDQPVGLALVGPAFGEAALLRMAYAYEQATLHRRAPQMPASVSLARA